MYTEQKKKTKNMDIPGRVSLRLINTTPGLILTQWLSFCDKGISAKYPALKLQCAEFYKERKPVAAARGPQYPAVTPAGYFLKVFVHVNVISGFQLRKKMEHCSMCTPYCALTAARHQGAGRSSRAAGIQFVSVGRRQFDRCDKIHRFS